MGATALFLALTIEVLAAMPAKANEVQTLNGAEYRSAIRQTSHATTATGTRTAVAVTSAAQAAAEILPLVEEGRMSAADAALSLAFSQIVASGGSWVSLSGILSAMVYDPDTGSLSALDAGYRVPLGETRPGQIPSQSKRSGRGVLTPGFLMGTAELHGRFGSAPWSEILAAPIRAASEGVPVSHNLAQLIGFRADILRRSDEAAAIFAPAGRLLQAGDTLQQPQLASLLAQLASKGPEALQTGDWAGRFVAAAASAGGDLSMTDFEAYRAEWTAPESLDLPPYRVNADTSQLGGRCLIDALAELQGTAGAQPTADPATRWERIIRASHRCYVLAQGKGLPPAAGPIPLAERLAGSAGTAGHSDVVAVAAPDGQVVVLCHSINTTAWGELGIFVDGVALPDSASFQQRLLRDLGPGDRVPNGLVPMITTRDGRPYAAAGAIGGSVSELMLQVTFGMVAEGRGLAEALGQPQVLRSIWPAIGWFQVGLGVIALAVLLSCLAISAPLPVVTRLLLAGACLASATFSVGVLVGGIAGCRACIAALDWPRVILGLGAAAFLCVAFAIPSIGLWRAALPLAAALCAVLLPVVLRSSLVPVNLVLPGTLEPEVVAELGRRRVALREIGTDPPFGYLAGVRFAGDAIEAAVSKTSLDGGAYAK
ncbi:gamma-glutamyltransferase [Mesorhizobium sp. M0204]|uniref:gamma-glutamyltransferase n=1 Tax=unclassified Mesorhizobium TaxID=325217 RepID=UPI00333B33C1